MDHANIEFAEKLYSALQGSISQRCAIVRQCAKDIEEAGASSILRAQVVWSVNKRHHLVPPEQLPTLSGLAIAAEGFSDDARRKQRDYLTLIGFWSRARLEHYGFDACSTRALRFWIKLAHQHVHWEECVKAVNLALVSRHERSLQDPKTNRLGIWRQQTVATKLPAELQDVKAACQPLPDSEREALQTLLDQWLNPCRCLLERITHHGHDPQSYMVSLDRHSMLTCDLAKPAVSVKTCNECLRKLASVAAPGRLEELPCGMPALENSFMDFEAPQCVEDVSSANIVQALVAPFDTDFDATDLMQPFPDIDDYANMDIDSDFSVVSSAHSYECLPIHGGSQVLSDLHYGLGMLDCGDLQLDCGLPINPVTQLRAGILTPDPSPTGSSHRFKSGVSEGSVRPFVFANDGSESSQVTDAARCDKCLGECELVEPCDDNVARYKVAHRLRDLRESCGLEDVLPWSKPRIRFARTSSNLNTSSDRVGVREVSEDAFCTWAKGVEACPDIVAMRSQNSDSIDRHEYGRLFCRRHASLGVNLLVHRGNSTTLEDGTVDEFLAVLSGSQTLSAPITFLRLEEISSLPKPAFLQLERFKLLQTLASRRTYATDRKSGGSDCSSPCDLVKALAYGQYHSAGSYVGANVDVNAGSWMRVVFGTHIFWLVPPAAMTTEDWNEFAAHGSAWNPGNKAQVIVLNAGDVLLLGPRVVYGGVTIEESAVEGGVVWDDRNLVEITKTLFDLVGKPTIFHGPFPLQLPEIIDELENVLDLYESSIDSRWAITESCLSLYLSGCQCLSFCGSDCPCHLMGSRCTPWCAHHRSYSKWSCLTVRRVIGDLPMISRSEDRTARGSPHPLNCRQRT